MHKICTPDQYYAKSGDMESVNFYLEIGKKYRPDQN